MGWGPLGLTAGADAWGVLGGTFDPIHYAHLAIAEQARETLHLAGVLFVPAGIPPHKPDRIITQPAHRVAMVERAIEGNPCFRLSRAEVDRPGVSYAVDTLELLQAEIGEPVFILSVEALRGLPTWRDPARVLDLCRMAAVPRRGYRSPGRSWVSEHFPGREDRVQFLDGPDLGNSASDIRRLASLGRSIRYLVPDTVADYITERRLYPPELWTKN